MLTPQESSGLVAKVADAAALQSAALGGGRSLWSDARRRFLRNRAAIISLVVLAVICLACVVGPWVLPHAFDSADWDAMSIAPSFVNSHFWGTDDAGRDLLVRCLIGGRVSLTVGLLATISSVTLGIVWGATAGFVGGMTIKQGQGQAFRTCAAADRTGGAARRGAARGAPRGGRRAVHAWRAVRKDRARS